MTFSVFHDLMRSCHFQKFQSLTGEPVLAYICIFFLLYTVQQKQTLVSTKMHVIRTV